MSTPTPSSSPSLCRLAEEFVQHELANNDASHDWQHIARVRAVALSLAAEEGLTDSLSLEVVELAALLHDVGDWKYTGSETAGIEMARAFLEKNNYPQEKVNLICHLIDQVGFKNELKRLEAAGAATGSASPSGVDSLGLALPLLLGVVQDADRLDAIGAIGVARCFTYGGAKGRPLYDPAQPARVDLTAAAYQSSTSAPTINHFYEKLLRLKDLMKTEAGKKRAQKRHEFMLHFLDTFHLECEGKA